MINETPINAFETSMKLDEIRPRIFCCYGIYKIIVQQALRSNVNYVLTVKDLAAGA